MNVTQSNGRAAWQEVFHYHIHVVPRYGEDGLVPPMAINVTIRRNTFGDTTSDPRKLKTSQFTSICRRSSLKSTYQGLVGTRMQPRALQVGIGTT
jgi:HIT domain